MNTNPPNNDSKPIDGTSEQDLRRLDLFMKHGMHMVVDIPGPKINNQWTLDAMPPEVSEWLVRATYHLLVILQAMNISPMDATGGMFSEAIRKKITSMLVRFCHECGFIISPEEASEVITEAATLRYTRRPPIGSEYFMDKRRVQLSEAGNNPPWATAQRTSATPGAWDDFSYDSDSMSDRRAYAFGDIPATPPPGFGAPYYRDLPGGANTHSRGYGGYGSQPASGGRLEDPRWLYEQFTGLHRRIGDLEAEALFEKRVSEGLQRKVTELDRWANQSVEMIRNLDQRLAQMDQQFRSLDATRNDHMLREINRVWDTVNSILSDRTQSPAPDPSAPHPDG